jgi:predicted dinucleotide-binding enzyme
MNTTADYPAQQFERNQDSMSTLGIIGSGNIGSQVARLAVRAGFDVVLANSRGPHTLTDLVSELGPRARAGTIQDAASSEVIVLSVPLTAALAFPPELLAGKIVLDSSNYYPSRDGRILELDTNTVTTSELIQSHLTDTRLVKAFNNILARHLLELARPSGAGDRSALPLASDDSGALAEAASIVDALGFDAVDTGSLADSWRFEPESSGYTRLYLENPSVPDEQIMDAPSAPLPAHQLVEELGHVTRIDVSHRLL